MFDLFLTTILLFLPGGCANMAPIFAKKIPWLDKLNIPVDAGKTFRGKRILGDHKTWRGFISGVISAVLISYFLSLISPTYSTLINHKSLFLNPVLFGFLTGFGALFGDATKSFFKRQIGVKPGKAWVPFDQIDYVLGIIVFGSLVTHLMWQVALLAIPVFVGLHFVVSYLGYLVGLKEEKV